MKVIFIKPNMISGVPGDAMEPLVFAILSGLTPPDVERKLFDERIEPIDFDEPADLVAITTDTFSAKRAYQIAGEYRRRGATVVAGGFHPSLCPEEAAGYVDAVVIGDAEDTWPRILDDVTAGSLQPLYRSAHSGFGASEPDRSIFDGKKYGPVHLVEYNRGCRFACDFCSIRAMYKSRIRRKSVDALFNEISQHGRRHLFFTDDNLFADETSLRQILEGLSELDVHWSCQISTDVLYKPGLVDLMARSGCTSVTVGIESLSRENLSEMRKSWTGRNQLESIRAFQRHGIMVYGTFVIGYDHDDPGVFDQLLRFATESKLFLANFNPLIPTPGTPLYDRLKSEGRLIYDRWWLDPRYRYGDCVFQPKRMTARQLRDGCFHARREFNRLRRLFSRFPGVDFRRARPYQAGLFVTANLVSRREMYRKQGRPLGEVVADGRPITSEQKVIACV